jgi:hypothetical protein
VYVIDIDQYVLTNGNGTGMMTSSTSAPASSLSRRQPARVAGKSGQLTLKTTFLAHEVSA